MKLVQPVSKMDQHDFIMHMNMRHNDSLGGMVALPEVLTPSMEAIYRAFHERLHATRLDYTHEHGNR